MATAGKKQRVLRYSYRPTVTWLLTYWYGCVKVVCYSLIGFNPYCFNAPYAVDLISVLGKKLIWHQPVGSNADGSSSCACAVIAFLCCIHRSSDSKCFSVDRTTPKNCPFSVRDLDLIYYMGPWTHPILPSNRLFDQILYSWSHLANRIEWFNAPVLSCTFGFLLKKRRGFPQM